MAFFMAMLYLTEQNRDGVEITPEMIEAGGVALIHSAILSSPYADIDEAVEDVYRAMRAAAKTPQLISQPEQTR